MQSLSNVINLVVLGWQKENSAVIREIIIGVGLANAFSAVIVMPIVIGLNQSLVRMI